MLRFKFILLALGLAGMAMGSPRCPAEESISAAHELASRVMIYRDAYGVPHVVGEDDLSVVFGFGYAQAEDYFWQVEDAYILALGRYAEVHGPTGLNSDLLNRAFEITGRSRRDFAALDRASKKLCAAFVTGINYFLETHPATRPRLITHFEPWHVLAYHRHVALELCFRLSGLSEEYLPRRNPQIWAVLGSNGWAIDGSRSASGHAMLLANPHMPNFGFVQLAEAHLCRRGGSGRNWNFSGAGFYGSPMLALGHNDRLGWTLVSNEPDIADVWQERFSDPDNPLRYEYDGGYRLAEQWTETIHIAKSQGIESREFTFRKTHHGPIVAQEAEGIYLSAQISGLFEAVPMRQALAMIKSRSMSEFRQALGMMQILYMNVLYADCEGNIQFLYTGHVPRRNPQFDWAKPVEGNDPDAEWLGFHSLDELPQVVNPPAGFVQNCNSTPLITTAGENPRAEDFPSYMIGDVNQRRRRALRSLEILDAMHDVTFDQWQQAAFDTEVYWARHEMREFVAMFEVLKTTQPELAERAEPLIEHLLKWNGRITLDSSAATLCEAWYEQLYGREYPGETLRAKYRDHPEEVFQALVDAADRLEAVHGKWRIPYGDVFRCQRQPYLTDLVEARFDDRLPSLPSLGGQGPMGVIYTQYYTPSINLPLILTQRRRYAMVGTSYLAAYEFDPQGVRAVSLVPFGTSGDRRSPHFFDQAQLLAARKFKTAPFTLEEVEKEAVNSYHPGAR